MENITSKMDSVFDDAKEVSSDFDVMFDEDDHLVDVVEGFASNGKPLTGDEFDDIHLSDDEKGDYDSTKDLDDDCTPDDIKDALTGDELMGASLKDIENGDEWDLEDNDKLFRHEEKDAAEKWFEDSDKEYQKSDFHGSVDPENINKSLEAQREAMAFLEGDEDDSIVHDDMDSTKDIMDMNPKDSLDIEDEDDADSRDDDTAIGDGVGELKESAMAFLESDNDIPKNARPTIYEDANDVDDPVEECGQTNNKSFSDVTEEADADTDEKLESAMNFLESDGPEGILADNDENDVHKKVQCDGTADCKCPMCRSLTFMDSELAVGDTFKEEAEEVEEESEDEVEECGDADPFTDYAAKIDAEFEAANEVETEEETIESSMNFLESDDEMSAMEDIEDDNVDLADDDSTSSDVDLSYDISDEDIISAALDDDI